VDLERLKKETRKCNLKYDVFMSIVGRAQAECDMVEKTLAAVLDLASVNQRAKGRVRLARFKQHWRERDSRYVVCRMKLEQKPHPQQ
jgi:hypothetical protein